MLGIGGLFWDGGVSIMCLGGIDCLGLCVRDYRFGVMAGLSLF